MHQKRDRGFQRSSNSSSAQDNEVGKNLTKSGFSNDIIKEKSPQLISEKLLTSKLNSKTNHDNVVKASLSTNQTKPKSPLNLTIEKPQTESAQKRHHRHHHHGYGHYFHPVHHYRHHLHRIGHHHDYDGDFDDDEDDDEEFFRPYISHVEPIDDEIEPIKRIGPIDPIDPMEPIERYLNFNSY